jgi:hypothetical protein
MTLVHVILKEEARADERLRELLRRTIAALGMQRINQKRFERYGVLTGEIDESRLPEIEEIAGVQAVERDRQRHSS